MFYPKMIKQYSLIYFIFTAYLISKHMIKLNEFPTYKYHFKISNMKTVLSMCCYFLIQISLFDDLHFFEIIKPYFISR